MGDLIRVTPSGPAPNYAPAYLAQDLGFFEEENLEVDTSISAGPGSSWLADNLLTGKADIALGGIWIPITYKNKIGDFPIFAMVCNRNPQVIMSRKPIQDFTWKDLYNKKLLLSMSSTSQWMFLEGLMMEANVDLDSITIVRDLDKSTTMHLWLSGFADYYLVRSSESEILEDKGYYIATTLAEIGGSVPWSVFYTVPKFINHKDKPVTRFARAIQYSLDWIQSHESDEIARVLEHRFPDITLSILTRSIKRLRSGYMWANSIKIPEKSFNRYQTIIANYGLINEPYPFSEVVNTSIAEEVFSPYATSG